MKLNHLKMIVLPYELDYEKFLKPNAPHLPNPWLKGKALHSSPRKDESPHSGKQLTSLGVTEAPYSCGAAVVQCRQICQSMLDKFVEALRLHSPLPISHGRSGGIHSSFAS